MAHRTGQNRQQFGLFATPLDEMIAPDNMVRVVDAFVDARPTTTVAKWSNGETTFQTLRDEDLDYWLKEYSLGNLFKSGELEQME